MGQNMNEKHLNRVRDNPRVKRFTKSHLILDTGQVVDPNDFIAEGSEGLQILKFHHSEDGSNINRIGEHVMLKALIGKNVFGDNKVELLEKLPFGFLWEWEVEETITGEKAHSFGLL
jgi:hypothetical protein